MQQDFFTEREAGRPLVLEEHSSASYNPRTGANARAADVTVAFAVDFTTAGERLTRTVAGARYVGVRYGAEVAVAAQELEEFLRRSNAHTLNVAGNGSYTLHRHGVTQSSANQWVFEVLALVHARRPLHSIRSGGQTGIDTAGLVAALALNIPAIGLYPRGYRQRGVNQVDVCRVPADLEAEIIEMATRLTRR